MMGYILPINQEQYALYHMREIHERYNFYQIHLARKMNRLTLFQEKSANEKMKYYSEITGKGRFIDITI